MSRSLSGSFPRRGEGQSRTSYRWLCVICAITNAYTNIVVQLQSDILADIYRTDEKYGVVSRILANISSRLHR